MFQVEKYTGDRKEGYELVIKQLQALVEGETNQIANLANAAALLNQFLHDINWVGFYLTEGEGLVLGPFQGLPACVRIPFGKGVCGTAASKRETVLVEDVHLLPIIKNGELIGVLDIDSPIKNRFDEVDQYYLEKFIETLTQNL